MRDLYPSKRMLIRSLRSWVLVACGLVLSGCGYLGQPAIPDPPVNGPYEYSKQFHSVYGTATGEKRCYEHGDAVTTTFHIISLDHMNALTLTNMLVTIGSAEFPSYEVRLDTDDLGIDEPYVLLPRTAMVIPVHWDQTDYPVPDPDFPGGYHNVTIALTAEAQTESGTSEQILMLTVIGVDFFTYQGGGGALYNIRCSEMEQP